MTMATQPKESEKAKAAYAIYEGLGTARTLEKTAEAYRRQNLPGTSSKPASTKRVLSGWSAQWHWQDRIAAYEEKFRAKQQTAAEKARLANIDLVRTAKERLVESLDEKTFRADSTQDLERLVKLEMQLLGAPLTDKHEVSGDLNVRVATYEHLSADELAALAAGGAGGTGEAGGADCGD
jgi:hypothetical protein